MPAGEGKVHNPDSINLGRSLVDDPSFCKAVFKDDELVSVDLGDGYGIYFPTSYDADADAWDLQR